MRREYFLSIIIISVITVLLFAPFFFMNKYPFPGDFLIAWFEPWKSEFSTDSFISISHKPIADDVFRQLYPFKIFAMSLIKSLEPPLWNPYNGAGMPLLATMHVGFLNPFNVLFLFLSNQLAWAFQVIIQPLLIGIFLYFYTRQIGIKHNGALFASISFMLSGFVITRAIYSDYDFAVAGFILLLFALESFIQSNSKKILLAPFAIFLIITATQPQIIIYLLGFSILYFLIRLKRESRTIRTFLFVFGLFGLGVGLTAAQLIPTLELIQYSNINALSSRFIIDRFLLPPQHFISLLIPNYFGNQATYNYWGSADFIETITSFGTIPIFFAFLSLKSLGVNKKIVYLFVFTSLITIFLTLDSPITHLLYSIPLPILSTSIPSRILILMIFSTSILSGIGFDHWRDKQMKTKEILKNSSPLLIVLCFITIGTVYYYLQNISCNNDFVQNCRTVALRNTILEYGFFILFISLILFSSFFPTRNILKKITLYCSFILLIALGLYNAYKFIPFTDKNRILPETNLIQTIQDFPSYYRTFGFGKANIKTNFATYFSFYDPNYYDPLYIKRYAELIAYGNGQNIQNIKRSDIEIANSAKLESKTEEKRLRLLNILGVKQLIYSLEEPDSIYQNKKVIYKDSKRVIVENESVLPHAYLVTKTVHKPESQILDTLFDPNFDILNSAVTEKNIDINNPSTETKSVSIKNYSANNIQLTTATDGNSLLVLSDNYYPGWKAYIDNKEVPIERVNYSFRGVFIPTGIHEVNFLYNPLSFKIGLMISFTSFCLYLLCIIFRKKITHN